jgi:hypothetical protein
MDDQQAVASNPQHEELPSDGFVRRSSRVRQPVVVPPINHAAASSKKKKEPPRKPIKKKVRPCLLLLLCCFFCFCRLLLDSLPIVNVTRMSCSSSSFLNEHVALAFSLLLVADILASSTTAENPAWS